MKKLDNLEKKVLKMAGCFWCILLLYALFLQRFDLFIGLFLGGFLNIVSFWHLASGSALFDKNKMTNEKILNQIYKRYYCRLVFIVVALVVSSYGGVQVLIGTVTGLLIVKLAIMIEISTQVLSQLAKNYKNKRLSK